MRQVVRKTQLCHLVKVDHLGSTSTQYNKTGLESEGLTLRSGNTLRGRTPLTSQMSDTQASCESSTATVHWVQSQTVLSQDEGELAITITFPVSAAAADL